MLSPSTLQAALDFRRERDWEQFHTPQNLAIAVSVEAGELLEQFQWLLSPDVLPDTGRMLAIKHEIADIAILLTYLAHDLRIGPRRAIQLRRREGARLPPARRPLARHPDVQLRARLHPLARPRKL